MTSYLLTFTVYTTAMVGVIFLALFAYKKFSVQNNRVSDSNFLEIEDCVNIGVRKQLYIVRAGEEKFLIASDAERTTFLSKLNAENVQRTRKGITSTYDAIRNFYPEEERENARKGCPPPLSVSQSREPDLAAQSDASLKSLADVPCRETFSARKDATAILRNIISTGERR